MSETGHSLRSTILSLFLLILSGGFIPDCCHAQYFERSYGGNERISGSYFAPMNDHGIIIVGNGFDTTYHTSGYFIMRIDSNGDTIWTKTLSNAFSAYSYSVVTLGNGNIIMLGTHSGVAFQNVAELNVLDSSGNFISSFVYPPFNGWGTAGIGLSKSGDTSVALTLFNDGFISNNYYSVFGLNADLTTKWSDFVSFDGSFTNEQGLSSCPNGDVYTLSYYDNYFFGPNPLFEVTSIRKHDDNGNILLDSIYEFQCITTGIHNTSDGGAIVCGYVDDGIQTDMVAIRIDSLGSVIWKKEFGSFFSEVAYAIRQTADGGFVMLSDIADPVIPQQHDLLLVKLNANGDSLWAHKFGGVLDETSLNLETDGTDLVLMAKSTSFNTDHIYVVRTDSSGVIQSPFTVNASSRYLCSGDTSILTLIPVPSAGMHILWSTGDTTLNCNVTHTGNYSAIITDSAGHSVTTPLAPVYVAQMPQATFADDTVSLCSGTPLVDTSVSELTNTYEWWFDGAQIPGEISNYVFPQSPGHYMLIVRNFCSSDTAESFVDTLFELPRTPEVTAMPIDYVCQGDSFLLHIDSITPAVSFQWYTADDFNQYVIPGATDSIYYVHEDGLFLVQVSDLNGCTASSYPYDVAFDNDRVFVNPNGPTSFCEGGEVHLNVWQGSGYVWSNGDTTQYITADSSGDYFVSFIDEFGCAKSSDTITITVLQNPEVFLGNDTAICGSAYLTLDPGASYNNYLWNNSSVDQTLNASLPGPFPDSASFYVFVTDTNGCTDSDTIKIVFDICIGVDEISMAGYSLFPNPVTSGQNLQIRSPDGNVHQFTLYDLTGNILLSEKFRRDFNYRVSSSIASGIYVYKIDDFLTGSLRGRLVVH